jgi:8-oxo-dGTP pyrophosphatase MutT (NUDIX family)
MKKGEDYTGIAIVYFCHNGNGKFVMAKRSQSCRDEHGRWDIGGGGLEYGHTIEETLQKEIAEEYATDILDYEFLGHREIHREHEEKKTHWIALDFKVQVDEKKVRIGEPHKFDDIGWFSLDDMPSPMHSQLPIFFKLHASKL